MLIKALLCAVLTGALTAGTAGAASASAARDAPAALPRTVAVNALNTYNSGDDAGNDSWLEIDRSYNLAHGDGSPGSDIINEVSGASSGMSPKSSNGPLNGSSKTIAPGESNDE
ncbi:hypothetical protein [Actinomadura roseirufa]|uniref:hypothetical protein n=1 Tax=Actinomadura roseirufa TaxID=2094049 RepID=UPI0010415FBA|nr:hypothetical protein [Actinomadura roseirufa]